MAKSKASPLFPSEVSETPMMRQYRKVKEQYSNALVLFRMGDFYEAFNDDAVKMAQILDIALTKRANGGAADMDLAGFPYHALDTYLPRLVKAGLRVAICDQLVDPKLVKGLVPRDVTEVVTPGIATIEGVVERRENQFLASIVQGEKLYGISLIDLSTGEYLVAQGDYPYIERLITNLRPQELLVPRAQRSHFEEGITGSIFTTPMEDWAYSLSDATERLRKQFSTVSLKGFGIETLNEGIRAAGAILAYLELTKHSELQHIHRIARLEQDDYMWLDRFTLRNLEIFHSNAEGGRSLIDTVDRTLTPMGGRLLRRWLSLPLKNPTIITQRHTMVDYLVKHPELREALEEYLPQLGDLERLASRVSMKRIIPRELERLGRSLQILEPIRALCLESQLQTIVQLGEQLNPCVSLHERIARELLPDPNSLGKGTVIAPGVDRELDEYRDLLRDGKKYLEALQIREAQNTGIPSLKISFNNVFGYYFEVRNTHKDRVPPEWERKQTLTQAERYINPELKALEQKILHANENMEIIEQRLYQELVESLMEFIPTFQLNATIIARLDAVLSYARLAIEKEWSMPEVDESRTLDIQEGWHPVIADCLPFGEKYIPNSLQLDPEQQQILMITGPNMSGKSALLRQTALIVLLAQAGSFVPAKRARIGYVDKIFTRVGATDNISMGESTFMVEMTEAASILNNLSDRSLILLDEIGRGTSTYDGISIAWAMAEYIHNNSRGAAKTLFATHYHELNEMEELYPRIVNYHVSVREINGQILFIRKLEPGGIAHSLGIHVARIAGMPLPVVERAQEILHSLEEKHGLGSERIRETIDPTTGEIHTVEPIDARLQQLKQHLLNLDLNHLTPLDALNILHDLQREARQG